MTECVLPSSLPRVVLSVDRMILLHGGNPTHEHGEVTVDGPCNPSVACARVAPNRVETLVSLVRAALPAHHQTTGASPHYGSRAIVVQWEGGRCEIDDSSTAPIAPESAPAFQSAFDGIARAVSPPGG